MLAWTAASVAFVESPRVMTCARGSFQDPEPWGTLIGKSSDASIVQTWEKHSGSGSWGGVSDALVERADRAVGVVAADAEDDGPLLLHWGAVAWTRAVESRSHGAAGFVWRITNEVYRMRGGDGSTALVCGCRPRTS